MKAQEIKLNKNDLQLIGEDRPLRDKELVTKPKSYLRDAFERFCKNKGSVVAGVIILILLLYAIFGPLFTPYSVSYGDAYFQNCLPKSHLFQNTDFWDGCRNESMNFRTFVQYYAMGEETDHHVLKNQKYTIQDNQPLGTQEYLYYGRVDSYQKNGNVFKNLSKEEFDALQKFQDDHNIQVIFPITQLSKRPKAMQDNPNANFWYETKPNGSLTDPVYTVVDNKIVLNNIYSPYTGEDGYHSKMRIEGETPLYNYSRELQGGRYEVRVNIFEYYKYMHMEVYKDGITEPFFIFGSTNINGQDLFTCLACGARFSFILAISVALVNLLVGAIYGAIEGYYGGKADLIMERIVEILGAVPFMIVITLLKYHMGTTSQALIMFIAFFLTGWIGIAGTVRMQFYRYKNQEYVLASRTLGAKDSRIMFKHIFPNAIGTMITSCVLIIPGMIFSETSLSYLGIINLNDGNLTSVGTLLNNGADVLTSYPHIVAFPAVFISLLMLSFNLFGNGLRDAFNPSLRGSEE